MKDIMRVLSTQTKWCPVCGDAMKRVRTEGSAIVFRCTSCRAEVSKVPPRDNKRRRIPAYERRGRRQEA